VRLSLSPLWERRSTPDRSRSGWFLLHRLREALATIMALMFCKACGIGYGSAGEVPNACPECKQPAGWTTLPFKPKVPFTLTVDDRTFLRTYKIKAD
jgi:hypothetical protein